MAQVTIANLRKQLAQSANRMAAAEKRERDLVHENSRLRARVAELESGWTMPPRR